MPSQNPIPAQDAELLPTEKDIDNIVWRERMLELEYQLKLEQWSAWRRGKPTGVPELDSGPGSRRPMGGRARVRTPTGTTAGFAGGTQALMGPRLQLW